MLPASEAAGAERSDAQTLSAAAALLFTSGETTRRTCYMVGRLGRALGVTAELIPGWEASTLQVERDGEKPEFTLVRASPLGVDMNKVAQAEHLICGLPPAGAHAARVRERFERISRLPQASNLRFVLMCGAGALALAVIFGVTDSLTLAVLGVTALIGGVLRRLIARVTAHPLVQPLVASLCAGLAGAIAAHAGISGAQWVAVAPCMVLIPGPHILNACLDFARNRAVLGCGRLAYASVIVLMICAGLLCGLAAGGASLPATFTVAHAPFALDVLAAGVAVAAYGSYFSMPWRVLGAPVAIGMLAHSVRWLTMRAGGTLELATLAACLTVGILVSLVYERLKMPFAAMAFAASVSMMPGAYLFHMASALLFAVNLRAGNSATLVTDAMLNASLAAIISVTIAFGVIAPKMLVDRLRERRAASA